MAFLGSSAKKPDPRAQPSLSDLRKHVDTTTTDAVIWRLRKTGREAALAEDLVGSSAST